MSLTEPLKPIPIPVRPEDPDAVLDLQRMLEIACERAGYELRVDYRRDPNSPLRGELAAWARAICAEQPKAWDVLGFRKADRALESNRPTIGRSS